MLITENTLRKIIAEEYENLKKESGFGMGPRSQTPMGRFIDRANAATPPQSNDNKPTFYEQLKNKVEVHEKEIKEFIETAIKDMKPVDAYAKLNHARMFAIGDGKEFLSKILKFYMNESSGNK